MENKAVNLVWGQSPHADGSNISIEEAANFDINLYFEGKKLIHPQFQKNGEILEVVYTKTDITKYGIYKLVGSVKRNTVTAEDDGIIYYYDEYSRSTYLTQTTSSYEVSLGNTITITATGPEEGNYTFAFYREDASGWVLMRDYSSDNVLEWTPLKKGVYKIQVRIKADDAGSYENAVTKVYTITSGGLAGELDVNVFDGVTSSEAASYTTGAV